MVLHTCDRMAAGGIHDQLGGGFARYSVDAEWLVPHFEKMLYDNAQLAQLYLDAYLVSGEARYADIARDILDYVLRDMTHPEGGFYSAEDADSEGHEGKFYCWTRAELSELLTPEESERGAALFWRDGAGQLRGPQPSPTVARPKRAEPGGAEFIRAGAGAIGFGEAENVRGPLPTRAPAPGRQNARVLEWADARRDGARLRRFGRCDVSPGSRKESGLPPGPALGQPGPRPCITAGARASAITCSCLRVTLSCCRA